MNLLAGVLWGTRRASPPGARIREARKPNREIRYKSGIPMTENPIAPLFTQSIDNAMLPPSRSKGSVAGRVCGAIFVAILVSIVVGRYR